MFFIEGPIRNWSQLRDTTSTSEICHISGPSGGPLSVLVAGIHFMLTAWRTSHPHSMNYIFRTMWRLLWDLVRVLSKPFGLYIYSISICTCIYEQAAHRMVCQPPLHGPTQRQRSSVSQSMILIQDVHVQYMFLSIEKHERKGLLPFLL